MKTIGALLKLAAFLVVYLTACLWSERWANGLGAAIWPPDAVLLVALLVDPETPWWWYVLGALPVRWFAIESAPTWLLWLSYLNDSLKALLSAFLLRRTLSDPPWLKTFRDFASFVLVAALLSPALS